MEKLRGSRGSEVQVGVHRQGRDALLEFSIRRDRIELKSVPYRFMLAGARAMCGSCASLRLLARNWVRLWIVDLPVKRVGC